MKPSPCPCHTVRLNAVWLICTVSGSHKCLSPAPFRGWWVIQRQVRRSGSETGGLEKFVQCTTRRPLADRRRQGEGISDLRSGKLDEFLLTRQTQGCQITNQQICRVQVYLPLADRVKTNCCELQTHAALTVASPAMQTS